ncbi:unnamed protein product, partial [marine sediment metagenome]
CEAITYLRGTFSQIEAEKIKERTLRGKRERAKEGKIPHGGFARLYGYDYDRTSKKRIVNNLPKLHILALLLPTATAKSLLKSYLCSVTK